MIPIGCKSSLAAKIDSPPMTLLARDANISGNLRLHDAGTEQATIHGWRAVEDRISWKTKLNKGNYLVRLHYSEPYPGAAISVTIGERQFSALIEPGESWKNYKTADLGVIHVPAGGDFDVILQGIQLALKDDISQEALPDVHWLSLTETTKESTDNPVGVPQDFTGKPLFDGKTLAGWKGNNGDSTLEWFRAEDGAIVGGSMKENIPCNEFLRTDREYKNFDLRLKFKIKHDPGMKWNAGIQIHSQRDPKIDYEMIGYQADIVSKVWGGIYDESRRRNFLGTQLYVPSRKPDYQAWNDLIIRSEGPRIRIWVNGRLTLDYIEPYARTPHPKHGIIPLKGYIALQVHEAMNPFEAWYKDIRIQELK